MDIIKAFCFDGLVNITMTKFYNDEHDYPYDMASFLRTFYIYSASTFIREYISPVISVTSPMLGMVTPYIVAGIGGAFKYLKEGNPFHVGALNYIEIEDALGRQKLYGIIVVEMLDSLLSGLAVRNYNFSKEFEFIYEDLIDGVVNAALVAAIDLTLIPNIMRFLNFHPKINTADKLIDMTLALGSFIGYYIQNQASNTETHYLDYSCQVLHSYYHNTCTPPELLDEQLHM